MDFWASRIHSAKHLSNNSEYQFMEQEDDDDVRAWFPCPFCYVEIEIPRLCCHLQEEHCFDLKNAVCPVCAANLGKDPINHFIVQHSHSIKRRRKSHIGSGYNASRMLVKDLGDLNSFVGPNWERDSNFGGRVINETTLDPLLSPFFGTLKDHKTNQQDELSTTTDSPATDLQSSTPSNLDKNGEEDCEVKMQRAEFVQQLIYSTIF